MNRILAASLFLLSTATLAHADDWPQFRGVDRSGVSKETGLLKAWPKEGPKLLWTFKDAGYGHSGPAIVGDVLYTIGSRDEKDEAVLALDKKAGTLLWSAKIGPMFNFNGNTWGEGARSTPTVDGNMLYALGAQGDLVCLDLSAKGKEVWRKNLIKDLGGEMMTEWGFSESPLVDGDLVICSPGGAKGTVAALDKKTGAVRWQTAGLKNPAPYSSIVVAEIQKTRQYIQNSYLGDDGGVISGIDAKTGKVLWTEPTFKGSSYAIAPTPIVIGDFVYMTSGYNAGCHGFDIGEGFTVKDRFTKKNQKSMKNTHGGVVLVGEHVYGHSERLGWTCQELTKGNIVWSDNNTVETQSGGITAAEGMLYLFTEDGEVALVKADPTQFELVSAFKLPMRSKLPATKTSFRQSKPWAHPVISGGCLYLRDHDLIFCFDIKK